MAWTSVPKPTGTTYTTVNPMGKEQYDQSQLTYDDASTYYDGVNVGQWEYITKYANGFGSLTWNEMTRTWDSSSQIWGGGGWTNVAKPI